MDLRRRQVACSARSWEVEQGYQEGRKKCKQMNPSCRRSEFTTETPLEVIAKTVRALELVALVTVHMMILSL